MNKDDLLHEIAQTGYNAGFGAKKSFASLDIVTKGPNVIGFVTLAIGILSLVDKVAASPYVTAATIIVGATTLYLGVQKKDLRKWEDSGRKLTDLRDRLGLLYGRLKAEPAGTELKPYLQELESLRKEVSNASESDQVNFSGWYAHLKFFGEAQIKWISKELDHKFLRDKVPASFSLSLVVLLVLSLAYGLATCPRKIAASIQESSATASEQKGGTPHESPLVQPPK